MENDFQANNTNQPKPNAKRTIVIILCLLLVGTIAVAAVALLRNITPKNTQGPDTSAITPAGEVVKAIRAPGAIKSFEGFSQQANSPDSARVIYKAEGRTYTISTPAKESVLFVSNTPGPHAESSKMEDEVSQFITEKGYDKIENTGPATSNAPKYLTLKSSIGVCQLAHSQPTEGQQTYAFYELACVDSTAISQEYSGIEMLLSTYKENSQEPTFTEAARIITTEDTKSFSIVTLHEGETNTSLLFAAVDNNWEFIGDLSGNSSTESNGKYSISAEIRSKINNARYGDFLKKYFK